MAILTKKLKTGGGHWYDANGKACHTQPKAKGDGERSTTLTDARKLKLFPSVTTILTIFAKPGLERWKMKSIAEVAFDIPRIDGEDAGKFADRCMVKQAAPVEEASDFGTRCHDAIEKYFEGEPVPDELYEYVQPAFDWKQAMGLRFLERETILVNKEHGFAGMVDIVCVGKDGEKGVIDWKTRRTVEGRKVTSYDFQIHQIAAYAATYWGAEAVENGEVQGANCYISSTEPGRFDPCGYSPTEIAEAWETFKAACAIWRALKKYDPRQ